MLKMHETARSMLAKPRESVTYRVEGVEDALNFGFRYMESQDHVVEAVVVCPALAKRVFAEVDDSVLDPSDDHIGTVWTAKLIISKKVGPKQILFVNTTHSVAFDISDPDPNNE